MAIYVVDTGEREVYVRADADYLAGEKVAALGESVKYAEHFSDDESDVPPQYEKEIL